MSEQEQNPQKPAKSKEQMEKEKANTNAWQKKQEEKKKKKLQEQQEQKPVQLDQKALEKARMKEQRRLARQQMLKEQQLAKQGNNTQTTTTEQTKKEQVKKPQVKVEAKKEHKKVEEKKQEKPQVKENEKNPKKEAKKGAQSSAKQEKPVIIEPVRKLSKDTVAVQPTIPKPAYTQLLTLEHHISKSFPSASSINKSAQSRLIHKYLDQYINPNDTILILSRSDSWQPLSERCAKRVYLYPNHNEFEKQSQCENITCTYEDVAYLMEGTITKIFVELDMVFANGTGLTEKGNENIICMANEFKIPVIGFSGTWNFNAWNFLSLNTFMNKYGEEPLSKYDIIENDQVEIIVLEIGSVIPKQISGHLENLSKIYRGCDFNSIKW